MEYSGKSNWGSTFAQTLFRFNVGLCVFFQVIFSLEEFHVLVLADAFHLLIVFEVPLVVRFNFLIEIYLCVLLQMVFLDSFLQFFVFVYLLFRFCEAKACLSISLFSLDY